ncbi:MAG TPA: chitobiase/beta-hexosaminidase C-terminal domain-containing protein [Verrucomicrobiae bacterium]|jgi:hypothetical protein|nr:chitobiase/beta-hexosaminidase C-terminal domain-containing protein [Verrucomicrobiae bacterium]
MRSIVKFSAMMLAVALFTVRGEAAIALHDGSTSITYSAATAINQSFAVTAGASVLVVIETDRGGSQTAPASLAYGSQTLTRAITASTSSTFRNVSIFYLFAPAVGTHNITGTANNPSVWLSAYTLSGVDTNTPPLVGSVTTGGNITVNFAVPNVPTNAWAAVNGTYANNSPAGTFTITGTGGTPAIVSSSNDTTYDSMGCIANLAGGTDTFTYTLTSGGTGVQKMALVAAVFTPTGAPTAPTITSQPQPQSLIVGQTGGFIAAASGTRPLFYQWRFNGTNLLDKAEISGSLTSALTLSNLTPDEAGNYTLVVTNIYGSITSAPAALSLLPIGNPVISVQFVGNGTSLTPDQIAGIYATPNWNLDNQNSGGSATGLNDNTGASTAAAVTVTFSAGHYASSDDTSTPDGILMSGGFWSGAGYTVNVTGVPYGSYDVFVYMMNDGNPNRRYGLTLGAQTYWGEVFNGTGRSYPPYTMDTQTTDLGAGNDMNADVVEFANVAGGSFSINAATPDGNVAMMGIQIVSAVPEPPTISAQPAPASKFPGGSAVFSTAVYGTQPLFYQWRFNGTNLSDKAGISGSLSSTLTLNNLTADEAGNYTLFITNTYCSITSAPAALTMLSPVAPFFTQEPTPAAATNYIGGLVIFTASVDGAEPLSLQWQQNGTNIPGATTSSLVLSGLQAASAGNYTLFASNYLGTTNSSPAVLTVLPPPNPSALNVYTYHYDNTRQGANTNEVLLTLANVNPITFGKLFTYPVDAQIYAEPLYVNGVNIPGQGIHNVVYVVTQHDSVYAFDADSNAGANGGLLWSTNLGTYAPMPNNYFGNRYGPYHDIDPAMGITSTPVIDPGTGTIYLDAFTQEGTGENFVHRIHALNITNGTERSFSPVIVKASMPGKGVDSVSGVVTFNAEQELQRPALTLAGGILYVAYSGFADTDPYHGWIIGFNATNLLQLTNYVFNTTPNATVADFGGNAAEGGLWMGGNGLSVDANTNLFFEVGNGSFSQNTNGGDYGDTFVKLSTTNKLAVADYFTPYNQASLQASDADLGSGGPLLLPDSVGSTTHRHLIVGAGKEGKIHLIDRDNMGHFNTANDSQIVQEVPGAIGSAFESPAYFNYQIYYQGDGDVLKAFAISNAVITPTPVSRSSTSFGYHGSTPVVSANGVNNAIVWVTQGDAYGSGGPAVLHAYNATNLALELYNSSKNLARDNPGGAVKFTMPTVMNGKVYVGAEFALSVFGNAVFANTPTISPAGGLFTNSVMVTLADTTAGAAIYYTLDGTAPTTNSPIYTGPFTLTNSVLVQVLAGAPGMVNSSVVSASFIDSSAIGSGNGLTGQYWANTTSTAFTNVGFNASLTLTRTDAAVNFNWNSAGPDSSIGQTTYAVRWTGCVQPQYSGTYTFYATGDDGVRLWVNGQLLADGWADQGPTTYSGSITLNAQQLYNIRMDYYQNGGGAEAMLAWSSPSTTQAIIPQTQLYSFTNPPPTVVLTAPAGSATNFTASASVTVSADADALYNPVSFVSFYANNTFLGSVSNAPYALTATGLSVGQYALNAVAVDGSGLSSTSAPVNITVAAGTGQSYGLTTRSSVPAFFNMPTTFTGTLPSLLSGTGTFSDTTNRTPVTGLIPYVPNTPLWSDGAVKSRYLAVPGNGGILTPDQQIAFGSNGSWTFPSGTVFVKNFDLVVNETNAGVPLRRLETRLLVRDINGQVYGVTYKWRPDNSEADLLPGNLNEDILITNASGVRTQTWYYPSPADCLQCHTPVANYVLGVNTRQLNGNLAYPATGVTDNQLRTLNRIGLFYPAINEASITNYSKLSALTNLTASFEERARSYLDANCAQCHQPGGVGITFDARYDTPLANQNITNYPAAFNLGYDNASIIKSKDVWRSMIYQRMNTTNNTYKMPSLARNLIDTNAVEVFTDWINSLSGMPALPPPVLMPNGGSYIGLVNVAVQPPMNGVTIYYTLDGTLPTTNSPVYTGPFNLLNNATLSASAYATGYANSVAASALFLVQPLQFQSQGFTNNVFDLSFAGVTGSNYVLQASTNLLDWTPIKTNIAPANSFILTDPGATNFPRRFYRVLLQ